MKLLRNPWVVGLLALVAVGMVVFQVVHARDPRGGGGQAQAIPEPIAPSATPPAPVANSSADKKSLAGPEAPIDRDYADSHLNEWTEVPARDPFLLVNVAPRRAEGASFASPVSHWKLSAIWRQTGGRVAVINQRVYSEGDVIEGYKVAGIDTDRVWLDGPDGKKLLEFGTREERINSDKPGAGKSKP